MSDLKCPLLAHCQVTFPIRKASGSSSTTKIHLCHLGDGALVTCPLSKRQGNERTLFRNVSGLGQSETVSNQSNQFHQSTLFLFLVPFQTSDSPASPASPAPLHPLGGEERRPPLRRRFLMPRHGARSLSLRTPRNNAVLNFETPACVFISFAMGSSASFQPSNTTSGVPPVSPMSCKTGLSCAQSSPQIKNILNSQGK